MKHACGFAHGTTRFERSLARNRKRWERHPESRRLEAAATRDHLRGDTPIGPTGIGAPIVAGAVSTVTQPVDWRIVFGFVAGAGVFISTFRPIELVYGDTVDTGGRFTDGGDTGEIGADAIAG